ncbi:MAG: conjugative transposon protein TraM [Bacteroidaceae bacterium]|nr:conjugative transposon protein TraM [Bacteroidaceae bacterium]
MKLDFKKINFKQPKYMIPLLVFLPLLFIGYQAISMTSFEADTGDQAVQTESVNTDLPEVTQSKDIETKSKYQAMLDGFGKVTDYTAVTDAEKEEERKLEVDNIYKEEERRRIDSLMAIQNEQAEALRRQFEQQQKEWENERQASRDGRNVMTREQALEEQRIRDKQEQDEKYEQMVKQMQLIQKMSNGEKILTEEDKIAQLQKEAALLERARVLDSIQRAQAPVAVNKAGEAGEAYFNTVTEESGTPSLIKARVDRVEKVRDGSRIRLRLSEDIEIEGDLMKKGSYLYANVTGFSAQRVKANVTSVLIGDHIKKIDLAVYDLDGMEGFYVPSSNFREVSKDIGANAMNMNMNFNNSSGEMTMESLAMQSLQQALQGTTQAVSKSIRANRARIKFNTNVYLVDNSK